MTEKLILEKLENLEQQNNKMELKVDRIESTVSIIAVQSERIDHLGEQTKTLTEKYNEAFRPGGYIDIIKLHQAGCPRETMKTRFVELWSAYGLLVMVVIGIIWKIKG